MSSPEYVMEAAQEAMDWLYRLEHAHPADLSAFAVWLARSPLHVREFLLSATWDLVLWEAACAAKTPDDASDVFPVDQ